MKNRSKDVKQSAAQKQLNFDFNWEKLADMEVSLRKVVNSHVTLPFTHENIQLLLKFTREVIKSIEAVKSQQKHYREIQQSYNVIQSKLSNHENIVNSLEQQHMQRYKSLSDEIKNSKEYYEKAKKNLLQSEQQARMQYEGIKKQNQQLKFQLDLVNKQKQELLIQIKAKEEEIKNLKEHKQNFIKVSSLFIENEPKYNEPKLSSIICSGVFHRIANYLLPSEITNLQLLKKECRVYIKKSASIQRSLNKSIIKTKDRKIAYYHKHIDYFEKLYHKIPQQILQTTFYRYEILKQSIGGQILNVLNSSAMLFEGKFQDIDDDQIHEKKEEEHEGKKSKRFTIAGMNIDIQKQIKSLRQFNDQNPNNVLEIDEEIIREFLEDHKNSRQKLFKEISSMYSKIKTTAQIYSVDVESIGKFITNILINFSKVFVLSKNLYAEARNLQSLNTLILHELAHWDKNEVEKNSQIEDLKAQLEAERRLKIFFTNESIKSEQRALGQQNVKLSIESKLNKQIEKLDTIFRQKQELGCKLAECQKDLKNLKSDNREIRKAYESGKQKYNKILEELSVVKETILRMNTT